MWKGCGEPILWILATKITTWVWDFWESFIINLIVLGLRSWSHPTLEGISPHPYTDVSLNSELSWTRSWWEIAGKKHQLEQIKSQMLRWEHEPEPLIGGLIRQWQRSVCCSSLAGHHQVSSSGTLFVPKSEPPTSQLAPLRGAASVWAHRLVTFHHILIHRLPPSGQVSPRYHSNDWEVRTGFSTAEFHF